MKVCILTDAWTPIWGGGQTHIWQTSRRLLDNKALSIDVIVPTIIDEQGKHYPQEESFFNNRLRVLRIGPRFVFPSLFGRIGYCLAIIWYLAKNKYDIYHSHSLSTSGQLIIAKLLHRGKIYYTVHGGVVEMLGSKLLNRLKVAPLADFLIRRLIRYDCLIGVVQSDIDGIALSKKKVLIGNGVDENVFANLQKSQPRNFLNILNVGRMVPVKNQRNLILAFSRVRSKFKKTKLTIIGSGILKDELEHVVLKNHLQSAIDIVNFLPTNEVTKLYQTTDIFILPSTFEGFPITLLETMAAGIPAIVSSAGNCAQIVNRAKAGLVLSGTDVTAIQQGLEKMLSLTMQQRQKLGDNGRKFVLKNYTWGKIAAQIYEIYTDK